MNGLINEKNILKDRKVTENKLKEKNELINDLRKKIEEKHISGKNETDIERLYNKLSTELTSVRDIERRIRALDKILELGKSL